MTVDRNALRTNQVSLLVLVVAAFLWDLPWLVLLTGLALALGALDPRIAPFQVLYHRVLKGRLVRPDVRPEDPTPHRFAQALGGGFLLAAAVGMLGGSPRVGWALAWLVAALALVNLLFGFCVGCFLYLQLARLGLLRR
ncbi:MAG: DUF4395 domain-containing protein [Armatimonadetes bacterium]|nr:DUF4395 domain-containing protein [Armatimonadota bacterium]MDW8154656.1 DUF4395 domain-containing protein [Armatimonadota bacterium]